LKLNVLRRNAYKVFVRKPGRKIALEDQSVDEEIILEWILVILGGKCGLNACGCGYGSVAGSCEHSNNKHSDVLKGGNFLTSWATVSFRMTPWS
jgi:hypothetical protein